jgi:glycosyltransferase involved in cell wall biosynthesis
VPCGETTPAVEQLLGLTPRRREDIPHDLPAIVLRHRWPPRFMNPARARYVHIQPWEYGHAPRSWIEALRARADSVWCNSRYVRDVYVASGIDPARVAILPHGIDPAVYHPAVEPLPVSSPDTCIFLYVGGMPPRKNVGAVIDAYLSAFRPGDDVALILKDNLDVIAYRSGWPEKLRALAARTDIPPVRYVETAYSDADMARLFRTATALVHPYHGEGFALPVLEAMACGTPVIVTRGGATDDFVDAAAGTLLPSKRVDLPASAVEFELTAAPWWLEPDRDALIAALRDVFERRDAARERGRFAAERALSGWTWAHAAVVLADRTSELLAVPARPPAAYRDALDGYAYRISSRGGEDGMLYELFLRLRVVDPFFVELGAADEGGAPSTLFAEHGNWNGFVVADEAGMRRALEQAPAGFDLLSLGSSAPEAAWIRFAPLRPRVVIGPDPIAALAGPLGYTLLAREPHAHRSIALRSDLIDHVT